ncbi:hypothetical protein Taro_005674 [Colocasia esculenta]|uniref:Uncharacterized protein n=1 Tax=Colocasia esculenta TaxID=4460 RepID=A0A843TQI2_COLES|nr:hypothetical protein [Colocasia esculenta]
MGELLRGFSERFKVLEVFGACSHREDVMWSGGNAEGSPVFTFFAKLGEGFSSGELRLGSSVGCLGGRPWSSLQGRLLLVVVGWVVLCLIPSHCSSSLWHAWMLFKGEDLPGLWEEARGSPELGGGGLLAYEKGPCGWIFISRWRHIDASPSETPEGDIIYVAFLGCASQGVAFLKATPGLSPSQSEKGLGNLLSVLLPLRLGFLGTCETSKQFPPRRSEEMRPQ